MFSVAVKYQAFKLDRVVTCSPITHHPEIKFELNGLRSNGHWEYIHAFSNKSAALEALEAWEAILPDEEKEEEELPEFLQEILTDIQESFPNTKVTLLRGEEALARLLNSSTPTEVKDEDVPAEDLDSNLTPGEAWRVVMQHLPIECGYEGSELDEPQIQACVARYNDAWEVLDKYFKC